MKFAQISSSNKKEDFGIKGIFLKLPPKIIDYYLLQYHPFCIEQTTLAQTQGYHVKIYQPIQGQTKQIQKLLLILKQKEVDILLTPPDMELPSMIDISSGNIINALFVLEAAKKAIKRQSKTLQQSKFLIIDGKNFVTDIVLNMLYPHVNDIAIYTDREEYFSQKAEQIYEEYGLCLSFFSGVKNKQFEIYNIIINCSDDMDNYDYKIQKHAFFFDVVQNHKKIKRILSRRNDLLLCNGLMLKWHEKIYLSKQIEAVLRITEKNFYDFLFYNKENISEIIELLQQKQITVTALTRFEKRI